MGIKERLQRTGSVLAFTDLINNHEIPFIWIIPFMVLNWPFLMHSDEIQNGKLAH